ncbi:hypothetical protein KSP35_18070 [Aquihabitans sp. G128]|uniref:hypothetical protein n=1 Tax=Aquihabitans sp. G128 TaxID=2849779 RepID=UPI001C213AFA|nr:hypothetical protein [Aquihabitans sp. G128]QXC60233.1 hypothetical protein KSP35_18070 [Aquihabitans sp. G128]
MRFTRLVIEADQSTVSLALHPRLTVVAGVDGRVRSGLVDELIGGLGSTRSGVHLELADDEGRHLAVFRPTGGSHRVIEVDEGRDVSDEFRSPDGRIDLLAHHGIDPRRARTMLHLDRSKLAADTQRDEIVNRLAELDQTELWSTAARVRITDDELEALNDGIDLSIEDAEVVAKIEKRHQQLEQALEQLLRLRRSTAIVSAASLLAALPVTLVDPAKAVPILAIGLVTILLTFLYRARVEAAQRSETTALAAAGADSYLGFVVQRVDGMFSGTEQRRRLIAVAEDHRSAAVNWTRLAGDVSVEWAMAHHDDIEATARLRRQLRSLGQVSSTAPELDEETADIAHAVVAHLTRLRTLGSSGESFPLILDDPFTDVPASTKLSLLELLSRTAGSPQVILLTDQEEVASWARLEALTGEVALVEPQTVPRDARQASELAV